MDCTWTFKRRRAWFCESTVHARMSYHFARGVEQNKAKGAECYKKAALLGCARSRYFLGSIEKENGNLDSSVKHWLFSAKMGCKDPVDRFKGMFMMGVLTKDRYMEALVGYQNAVEETKSHDRDEAAKVGF